MARHLNYNPGRDSVEYLEAINSGENRLHILEQLLIALRGEIGRPNHQHHLLIGPRGAGKTHLLRILTAGRIPADPALVAAYLPVVMPEETTLRTPGDLFLKFVERLSEQLKEPSGDLPPNVVRSTRGLCLSALTAAKGMRDPLERLEIMADALESAAKTLGRILLPIAENMDQTFYLGAQRGRKGPLDEQWALRRHLQESPHLLIIGAAPSIFGAVGDPGKPFYDFFRTHNLSELSNNEVLEIIRKRLEYEAANPGPDEMRIGRVRCLLEHFAENSPKMRGILVITGGLPRFIHLIYEVIVETDVSKIFDTLNRFLDDLTPYFQGRLDPRLIPQAEIDLLHTLALARGPLQPSELAEELYGVQTNEVSELLSRLQERGMVKRAGRPGGQAVTWDLTEPCFRVWTQFRDNPEGQEIYRILAKIVAVFYSVEEIKIELGQLMENISLLPDGHGEKKKLHVRKQFMDYAYENKISSTRIYAVDAGDIKERFAADNKLTKYLESRPQQAMRLFKAINEARKEGDRERGETLLEELRQLSRSNPDDSVIRESLAKGLYNTFLDVINIEDRERSQNLLEELRGLYRAFPDDNLVREALSNGLVSAHIAAKKTGNKEQGMNILDEMRILSNAFPNDRAVRKSLAKEIIITLFDALEVRGKERGFSLLEELRILGNSYSDDEAVHEQLAWGLTITIDLETDKDQNLSLLEELRTLCRSYPDNTIMIKQLAFGLFIALYAACEAGNRERSQKLLEELLDLASSDTGEIFEEEVNKAVMIYSVNMLAQMKAGEAGTAQEGMRWLEGRMPTRLANLMQPVRLAMDVLKKGEDQALAREPEEVRRVVRLLLEKVQ